MRDNVTFDSIGFDKAQLIITIDVALCLLGIPIKITYDRKTEEITICKKGEGKDNGLV